MNGHISTRGVHKVFQSGGEDVYALKAIDLEIARGEFVCLLGPSGCGKSTLLNAVAGFSLPTSGVIEVEGATITAPPPPPTAAWCSRSTPCSPG